MEEGLSRIRKIIQPLLQAKSFREHVSRQGECQICLACFNIVKRLGKGPNPFKNEGGCGKQKGKGKGMVLYSAVSSPLDRSKRFTLSSPGRPVHSDTVLGFSWKHSSHAAIAQRLFTHISITVYSQVIIYTAESTEASRSERKCPNFETVTTGIRTRALSIASPAFYQLSYSAPQQLHQHNRCVDLEIQRQR